MSSLRPMLFVALVLTAPAMAAPNLRANDPAYRRIDALVGAGWIDEVIIGQRPWSREQVAELILQARKRRTTEDADADALLRSLEAEFAPELEELDGKSSSLSFRPLASLSAGYLFLQGSPRAVPRNNNTGTVHADLSPLTAYREGQNFPEGSTWQLETEHSMRYRELSVFARTVSPWTFPQTGGNQFSSEIRQLYIRYLDAKIEIQLGRDSLLWGQSRNGGMLLSNNARPLDMLKVASPYPFHFPLLSSFMGPAKVTVFVANLGADHFPTYAFFYGFKTSFLPHPRFELGFTHTLLSGGRELPSTAWYEPLTEFFLIRSDTNNNTDHRFGLDMRWRLPFWEGTQWFFDGAWEDTPINIHSFTTPFTHRLGFETGFFFPRFPAPQSNLSFALTRTSRLLYRHTAQRDGYSLNRHLLGSDLGPDALRLSARIEHPMANGWIAAAELAHERYCGDTYKLVDEKRDIFTTLVSRPVETRWRAVARFERPAESSSLGAGFGLGLERAENFDFTSGNNTTGFLVQAAVIYKLP